MLWALGLAAVAQIEALVDFDQDGRPDASADQILVVLKDGVLPDDADAEFFSRKQTRGDWSGRKPRNAFGRMMKRWAGRDAYSAARAVGGPRSTRSRGTNRPASSRQIMRLGIDAKKASLREEIERLKSDPEVLSAEPDYVERPQFNDPYANSSGAWGQSYGNQWYLAKVSAPGAWAAAPAGAQGVLVAVIDSGVDRTHPDLSAVVWSNTGEIAGNGLDDDANGYVDDVTGWNFHSDNNQTVDTFGHGTLVAGLIAAECDNNFGISGLAPGAKIMALRNGESGYSFVSSSIEALYYAVDQGAQVVNMSFGGANYSSAFAAAVQFATENGAVLVASAGNDGAESYTKYPCGYPGVISVGATDQNDAVSSFSNYGPLVDLVAPGGGGTAHEGKTILGPRAAGTSLGTAVDSLHVRSSGTSFAAPLVAATAAMILKAQPGLAPGSVRQLLNRSADPVEAGAWNIRSSNGRLNAQRALTTAAPGEAEIGNLVQGQVVSGSASVSGIAKGPGFTGYVLAYGAGKNPATWVTISSGSTPVQDAPLGTWITQGLATGDYTLRLTAQCAGRPQAEDRVVVFLGNRAPSSRTGWPKVGLINPESMTVMDLDGDGEQEILLPTSGSLRAFSADGSAFGAGTYEGVLAWPSGPASVGDLDGDGQMEVGVISKSGTSSAYPEFHEVCFWRLDGTKVPGWPVSLVRDNDWVPHTLAPTVVDVDGDGRCEVLFPSVTAKNGSPRLHLVRGNGTALPGWPKTLSAPASTFIHCTTAAADINGDGHMDFVVADSSGRVHALDLAGNYLAGWPRVISSGSHIAQEIAVSDLDRDGRMDVIAGFYNGVVTVLSHDGSTKPGWPINLGTIPRPPAMADVDGDGDIEISIGTQIGELHLRRFDGTSMPGWPKSVSNRVYSPCLTDLNNDGKVDVVASDGNRTVHAWQADGTTLSAYGFPFQLPGSFGCYSPPVVKDLDGDSTLELVVYGQNLEVRNLPCRDNPRVQSFSHMHCDPANTCRYVLAGNLIKGQRFLTDRAGGATLSMDGTGLLAGSSVRIGNQFAATEVLSSSTVEIVVPPGLNAGWQDVWITHPNTGAVWLANAVLVVENVFGDSDLDGLSDQWEWSQGLDPMAYRAPGLADGALGDLDKDGVKNIVEEAFQAMQMNPHRPDAGLLPSIRRVAGAAQLDYAVDSRSQSRLQLEWSPDLRQWFKPGAPGYPAGAEDVDLGTGTGHVDQRRVRVPLPAGQQSFFRWSVDR